MKTCLWLNQGRALGNWSGLLCGSHYGVYLNWGVCMMCVCVFIYMILPMLQLCPAPAEGHFGLGHSQPLVCSGGSLCAPRPVDGFSMLGSRAAGAVVVPVGCSPDSILAHCTWSAVLQSCVKPSLVFRLEDLMCCCVGAGSSQPGHAGRRRRTTTHKHLYNGWLILDAFALECSVYGLLVLWRFEVLEDDFIPLFSSSQRGHFFKGYWFKFMIRLRLSYVLIHSLWASRILL